MRDIEAATKGLIRGYVRHINDADYARSFFVEAGVVTVLRVLVDMMRG